MVVRGGPVRIFPDTLPARGADASCSLSAAVWRDDDEMLRESLQAKPRLNLQSS
jgi:hypothetical protein